MWNYRNHHLDAIQALAAVVSALAFVPTLLMFLWNQNDEKKQRKDRRYEQVDQRYKEFLLLGIQYPHLRGCYELAGVKRKDAREDREFVLFVNKKNQKNFVTCVYRDRCPKQVTKFFLVLFCSQKRTFGLFHNHKLIKDLKFITPSRVFQYSTPRPVDALTADALVQRDTIYDIFTSMIEGAFLALEDNHESYREFQWKGWLDYICDYCGREDYQEWWMRVVGNGDWQKAMKKGASQYDERSEKLIQGELRNRVPTLSAQ